MYWIYQIPNEMKVAKETKSGFELALLAWEDNT
jgi:hypothetical protein